MTAAYEKLKNDFADATLLMVYEDESECECRRDEFMKGLNLNSQSQNLQFYAVLSWLNSQNIDISLLFSAAKIDWSDEELKRFEEINSLPFLPLDVLISAFILPCKRSFESFAGMAINGDTLSGAQIYALLRYFCEKFGYEFIGLGASTLLLVRESEPSEDEFSQILDIISQIYAVDLEILKEKLKPQKYIYLPHASSISSILSMDEFYHSDI